MEPKARPKTRTRWVLIAILTFLALIIVGGKIAVDRSFHVPHDDMWATLDTIDIPDDWVLERESSSGRGPFEVTPEVRRRYAVPETTTCDDMAGLIGAVYGIDADSCEVNTRIEPNSEAGIYERLIVGDRQYRLYLSKWDERVSMTLIYSSP